MPTDLTITRASLPEGPLLRARGGVDVRAASALQAALWEAAGPEETLTVDLAGVEVGGGAPLALVVNALRRLPTARRRVRVVSAPAPVRAALERTGVAARLELVERLGVRAEAPGAAEAPAPVPAAAAPRAGRPATTGRRNTLLAEATLAIEAHHADPDLALDQIARRIATSSRQLQRVFAELAGTTFRTEVNAVRMQHAADLLQTTRLPVAEIARRVGHRQAAQFARAFRRHHGQSPSAFRRAARRDPEGDDAAAQP
jgi:two-component system response regulator YesN